MALRAALPQAGSKQSFAAPFHSTLPSMASMADSKRVAVSAGSKSGAKICWAFKKLCGVVWANGSNPMKMRRDVAAWATQEVAG
jgi:hypothetical protein